MNGNTLKILMLVSRPLLDPDGIQTPHKVNLIQTANKTKQVLAGHQKDIIVQIVSNVTTNKVFLETETEKEWDIIHYFGHCTEGGKLWFENEDGRTHLVSPNEFVEICHINKIPKPKLVLFFACCSEPILDYLFGHVDIPCVGIMREQTINEDVAVLFWQDFYKNLILGKSLKECFDSGKKIIAIHGEFGNDACKTASIPINPPWSERFVLRVKQDQQNRKLTLSEGKYQEKFSRSLITVPYPSDTFIGRNKEIVKILKLIKERKIVAVTGELGQGKSEIVRTVAHFMADREKYSDGIFWASDKMDEIEYPLKNLETLLNAVLKGKNIQNVEKIHSDEKKRQVKEILNSGQSLLVLDNFETVENEQEIISFLQNLSSEARVLIATRHHLRPPALAHKYNLKKLRRDEAHALFLDLLERNGYYERFEHYSMEVEESTYVNRICKLLEDHPLSLSLAAGHTWYTSLKDIVEMIQTDRLEFLQDINPPQGTPEGLWKSLDLSLSQLDVPARDIYLKLSVFRTPFSLENAQAIIGRENLKTIFKELMRRNLLQCKYDGRYFLNSVLRIVSRNLLESSVPLDDIKTLYRKAADYYIRKEDVFESIFSLEYLKWLDKQGDRDAVHKMVNYIKEIDPLLYAQGLWNLEEDILNQVINIFKDKDKDKAELLSKIGCINRQKGNLEISEEKHRKALNILKQLKLYECVADQLSKLGLVKRDQGNIDDAKKFLNEALIIHKKQNNLAGLARDRGYLGLIYRDLGKLKKAEDIFHEALNNYERLDDLSGQADIWGFFGILYRRQGKLKEAKKAHDKALGMHGDNLPGQAYNLSNLGVLYKCQGKFKEAEEYLKRALKIDEEMGSFRGIANQLNHLGMVYKGHKEFDKAVQTLDRALEKYKQVNNLRGQARVLGNWGLVYKDQKKFVEAKEILERALAIDTRLNNFIGQAWILGDIGLVFSEQEEFKDAEYYFKKALKINKEFSNFRGQVWTLNKLGLIYDKQGNTIDAKTIFTSALRLYHDDKLDHPPGKAWSCYNLATVCEGQGKSEEKKLMLLNVSEINKDLDYVSPDRMQSL